jgi:hypothetical protein
MVEVLLKYCRNRNEIKVGYGWIFGYLLILGLGECGGDIEKL